MQDLAGSCDALSAVGTSTLTQLSHPACLAPTAGTQRPDHPQQDPQQDAQLKGKMYLNLEGRWINFEEDYEAFLGRKRKRYFGRALLEVLTELSAGGVWYLAQKDFNEQDWFFAVGLDGAKDKFSSLELVRFDDNTFLFNQMWHPLAGMGYYMFARVNNFPVPASFMFAVTSSTLWEYVLELPEKVSINDQISTAVGGMALGEVVYHLGELFNMPQTRGQLDMQLLTGLFGLPRWAHNHFDRNDGDLTLYPANRVYWPDFKLYLGATHRAPSVGFSGHTSTNLGLSTELIAMPGYHRPGSFEKFFHEGNFTNLELEASLGEQGFDKLALFARAVLFGYYDQSVLEAGDSRRGYSLMMGGSTAFEVASFSDRLIDDKYSLVHLLGPSLDFTAFADGLHLRAQLDAWGDFVAINSLTFPVWRARHGTEGIRSEIENHGYYFGYGATIEPQLEVGWAGFELGTSFQWGRYLSITGRDRRQEEVTRELDLDDHLARWRMWLEVPTGLELLNLRLTYDNLSRKSSVDEFDAEAGFEELGARVQYLF